MKNNPEIHVIEYNWKKLTNKQIAAMVRWEGLIYCIRTYINPDYITDPELKAAWVKAKTGLQEVEAILAEYEEVE